MDELINSIESLKESMEKTVESSRKMDMLLRFFLTDEEITEVAKLREKQNENMQRLVDISSYIVNGKSDKLEGEYPPNIDMVLLEMDASSTILENTETEILNIYAAARRRIIG